MLYDTYLIGGVLYHADRANHKYIKKVKTKNGKWRYIYNLGKQLSSDVKAFGSKGYSDFYKFGANGWKNMINAENQGYNSMKKFSNNSYSKLVNFERNNYNESMKRLNKDMEDNIKEWGKEGGEYLNQNIREYKKDAREFSNDFIRKMTDKHKEEIKDLNKQHKQTLDTYTKGYEEDKAFEKASRNEAKLNRRESDYYRRQAATAIGDKKSKKIRKRQQQLMNRLTNLLGADVTKNVSKRLKSNGSIKLF